MECWEDVGQYSTNLFGAEALKIIERHNASEPLFLYQAWQGVHSPRQAPAHYVDPYNASIKDKNRRVFAGMVSAVDEGVRGGLQACAFVFPLITPRPYNLLHGARNQTIADRQHHNRTRSQGDA